MTDDTSPTALDLPMVYPLLPKTQRYFDICTKKGGFGPKMLQAHVFDADKLNVLATHNNNRDIDSLAGFFNMSIRVANTTAMGPNSEYHSQFR